MRGKLAAGLALLCAVGLPGLAQACELAPDARPQTVAAYDALVRECLRSPPAPAHFDARAEAEFLRRVNDDRTARGLPALTLRAELLAPARFHSLDQAWNGLYGHDGAGGRSAADRIAALDRRLIVQASRENVAYASGDYDRDDVPELLHNGLMESPGHKANTLSADITHVAIGVARIHDAFVVTLVFVGKAGAFRDDIPLRADWAALDCADMHLEDWLARRIALTTADGRLLEGPGAAHHEGEARVLVRGETPPVAGAYRYIYLNGPLIELTRQGPDTQAACAGAPVR